MSGLEITDRDRRRTISLLLKDALAFTPVERIDDEKVTAFMRGLELLVLDRELTDEDEAWLFTSLLDAKWSMTAPFDPEKWQQLLSN
jgi:hypothetical protein